MLASLVIVVSLVLLTLWPVGRGTAAGELDPAFGEGGKLADPGTLGARALVLQPDGQLVTAGYSGDAVVLARYFPEGVLDESFGRGGRVTADLARRIQGVRLVLQPDGKLLVGAQERPVGWRPGVGARVDSWPGADFVVARFNPDGSPDRAFGVSGTVRIEFGVDEGVLGAVLVQPDGKLVAAGVSRAEYADVRRPPTGALALARLDADGNPDPGFGDGGTIVTPLGSMHVEEVVGIVGLPDGAFVLAVYAWSDLGQGPLLARFGPDGQLDEAFGSGGLAFAPRKNKADQPYSIAVQADGKLVLAGISGRHSTLWRFNPDGTPDEAFGSSGRVMADFASPMTPVAIAIEPDGGLVAAGIATNPLSFEGWPFDFGLARFNPDGTLDGGFGRGGQVVTDFGGPRDGATALAVQPDGAIVAAGGTTAMVGDLALALARYRPGPREPAAALPAECVDFIADVTIPDGTRMQPGERFTKTWRLANCGGAEWADYRAVRVGGDFGPEAIALAATSPLAEVDVTVEMTAPAAAGRHRAIYRLAGPHGAFAGGFFVEVVVAP